MRVESLYPWQHECISADGVLGGRNLVYSAPTSAGKTLVAEVLMCRAIQRRRKVVIALPYVAMAEENASRLGALFRGLSTTHTTRVGKRKTLRRGEVRVAALHAGSTARGLDGVDVAVCTLEKACSLISRLAEESRVRADAVRCPRRCRCVVPHAPPPHCHRRGARWTNSGW